MKCRHALLGIILAMTATTAALASGFAGGHGSYDKPDNQGLIVIAHRGASGLRPEHTLAAYRLAIRQGADFIEPDLVVTKDGVLIARHEPEIGGTTDVSDRPEFADRKTTKLLDGVPTEGWWAEDFTLAEIKTLRARERIPETRPRNTRFNDRFEIPTLAEIIQLIKREERRGRKVGIYPETKHPTYFAEDGEFLGGTPINMSLGKLLIDTLVENDFTDPDRIFIQSFEFANLIELQNDIMPQAGVDLPLVQLYGDIEDRFIQPASNFSRPYDMIFNAANGADLEAIYGGLVDFVEGGITPETGYSALISEEAINYIANNYAEGMGPWKNSFLLREPLDPPADPNGNGEAQLSTKLTGEIGPLLPRALQAGLMVHPYTLRAEENFLTQQANGVDQNVIGEAIQLYSLGVNGFFIDQPSDGVFARWLFLRTNQVRNKLK